jgi:hypothetical protein
LGITPDVFICALFGYSINIRICLVYDEVFRSSPEKCIILNNKTNEICNSGNSTQNFEEYFANSTHIILFEKKKKIVSAVYRCYLVVIGLFHAGAVVV